MKSTPNAAIDERDQRQLHTHTHKKKSFWVPSQHPAKRIWFHAGKGLLLTHTLQSFPLVIAEAIEHILKRSHHKMFLYIMDQVLGIDFDGTIVRLFSASSGVDCSGF